MFCLPSRAEALPLALLEAMMTGTVCVTTTVGEIPAVGDVVALAPPDDAVALTAWLGAEWAHRRHDVRRVVEEVRGVHDRVVAATSAGAGAVR